MNGPTKKLDNRHVAHWELQPGLVYFIAAGDPPTAIKIGISTAGTMRKRLKQHQSSNHEPLYLLGLVYFEDVERPMAEANHLENELHDRFSSQRRFSTGPGNEWFSPSEELLAYIRENAKAPAEFGLVESVAKHGPGLGK